MNINLVKGEAAVRRSAQPTWGATVDKVAQGIQAESARVIAEDKANKKAVRGRVAGYINNLNSNLDLTELTPEQTSSVTNFLHSQKLEYANAASTIAKIEDASSPEYMELRDKMANVNNSFKNLAGQLDQYKKDRIEYLKNQDEGRISEGNPISHLNKSADIYTNAGQMSIGAGGNLTFWDEQAGDYSNYGSIQKPFLKDYKAGDALMKLNESVFNSGHALTGARESMTKNRLKSLINQGGRDTLLSLATDDLIVDGGLNIQDASLFNPENEEQLKQVVIDSYMQSLIDVSKQGAAAKRPKTSIKKSGYGGSLRDEINTAAPSIEKAQNIANAVVSKGFIEPRELVRQIRTLNSGSKAEFATHDEHYSSYIKYFDLDEDEDSLAKFHKEYGNYPFYEGEAETTAGIDINLEDPQAVYEFIIQNSGLSSKAQGHFINEGRKTSNKASLTAEELIAKYRK